MESKMVGQKTKKKGKTVREVDRALVPTPVFAAVPRSGTAPAAMTPSSRVPAESQGTSSPRILGNPGSPTDEFSDPESSLFDYQQMTNGGYQTVEFGTWPARGRNFHKEAERPQFQYRSSGLYAEPGDIQGFEDTSNPVIKMISDIYATPVKKGKGKLSSKSATGTDGADDDKSMTGTHKNVQAEMRKIHDLPAEVNETMSRSVRQPANMSYNNPGSSTLPDSGRGSTRPGGRSSRSQKSKSSRELMDVMEAEQLRIQNAEIKAELQTLQEVAAAVHDGDVESAKTLFMQKQMSEMKEENEVLKSAVHRLNVELSGYQAKYRPVSDAQLKQVIEVNGLPPNGPVPSWLISKKYLAPLFLAYDDHLAKKDELIDQCKNECASIRKRIEQVAAENQMLRRTGGPGLGQGDSTEWLQLQEQAKLVLEENQVLMEQLEVQTLKSKDLYQAQDTEISRMARKLALSEGEKADLERELEQMRVCLREMKHKQDQTLVQSESHVKVHSHINMISDFKRSVVEEREQLERETDSIRVKLKASEEERKRQARELIDLSAENKSLKVEVKAMQKSVWKTQEKMALLLKAIELSENKEMITQEQLANVIKVAEKTALERDTVYKVAREQHEETKLTINKMVEGSTTVGKLELKLKLYQIKASAKLNTLAERLREQDEAFNSQKKEYEREIQHLRCLLKEKEEIIESIHKDRQNIERDLDTMWQAATSENKRIKNILLCGSRKLKDHAHIADALKDEMENEETLHFLEDEVIKY